MIREAKDAQEEADKARASGEIDRAEQLESRARSLSAAASNVGSRYEQLRATQPSGWDRTSRMESVLREARAIDTPDLHRHTLGPSSTRAAMATGSSRLLWSRAAQAWEAQESWSTASNSRSASEQYQALVAAESAIDHLPAEDRAEVRDAVESVLAGWLGDRSSDRRTVARRILNRLTRANGE
jgi:hypothetical protein